MSAPRSYSRAVTTDAAGDAVVNTQALSGRLINLLWTQGTIAATADITVVSLTTGQTLWSATDVTGDVTLAPRQPLHASDGSALLFAAAGEPLVDHFYLCSEPLEITIAQGGDTKTGTLMVITE